jgi:hypothetical protein
LNAAQSRFDFSRSLLARFLVSLPLKLVCLREGDRGGDFALLQDADHSDQVDARVLRRLPGRLRRCGLLLSESPRNKRRRQDESRQKARRRKKAFHNELVVASLNSQLPARGCRAVPAT